MGIEERRGLEGGEQVLGEACNERLGMTVLGEALELRDGGRLPFREELLCLRCEGGELGVGEIARLGKTRRRAFNDNYSSPWE